MEAKTIAVAKLWNNQPGHDKEYEVKVIAFAGQFTVGATWGRRGYARKGEMVKAQLASNAAALAAARELVAGKVGRGYHVVAAEGMAV